MMIWPILWPGGNPPEGAEVSAVHRAELLAGQTLRMLTLNRVGGLPITVMPCSRTCVAPYSFSLSGHSLLPFHPVLLESGAYANCYCAAGCGCGSAPSVRLNAPVGRIDEVKINGVVLDPSTYHVEDGNRLVRLDGKGWPACSGPDFTVTYLNGYEVDELGEYVGGLLALEYLKAMSADKKCRLPANVTTVSRQGISMELSTGMFPDGTTGIREVDAYLMQWNPYGMRTRPEVYSPDLPHQHAVTWRAP
jgi:hypothetical protein